MVEESIRDADLQDVSEPPKGQPPSPLIETEAVQTINPNDSTVFSANDNTSSENLEPTTDLAAESLSGNKSTLTTTIHVSLEVPDNMDEFSEQTRDISVEPTGQEIHYTVSEVMTDDAARSTAPPEDKEMDVVSVADDEGVESIPYIIEEPATEGRLTEVGLHVHTFKEKFYTYRHIFGTGAI